MDQKRVPKVWCEAAGKHASYSRITEGDGIPLHSGTRAKE